MIKPHMCAEMEYGQKQSSSGNNSGLILNFITVIPEEPVPDQLSLNCVLIFSNILLAIRSTDINQGI